MHPTLIPSCFLVTYKLKNPPARIPWRLIFRMSLAPARTETPACSIRSHWKTTINSILIDKHEYAFTLPHKHPWNALCRCRLTYDSPPNSFTNSQPSRRAIGMTNVQRWVIDAWVTASGHQALSSASSPQCPAGVVWYLSAWPGSFMAPLCLMGQKESRSTQFPSPHKMRPVKILLRYIWQTGISKLAR